MSYKVWNFACTSLVRDIELYLFSGNGQSSEGVFLVGRRSQRSGGGYGTKGRDEGSEVGDGVGALLG